MTYSVFVDESGNENLQDSRSPIFCCAAIRVNSTSVDSLEVEIRKIESKFNLPNGFKSSSIRNSKHRLSIVAELCQLEFGSMVLIVDKRKIDDQTGMQYKRSFRKSMLRRLFSDVRGFGQQIEQIVLDSHGSHEFQEGFKDYFEQRFQSTLYEQIVPRPEMRSSQEVALIRLADIVAGTYQKYVSTDTEDTDLGACIDLLGEKQIFVRDWPPNVRIKSKLEELQLGDEEDQILRSENIRSSLQYLGTFGLGRDQAQAARNIVLELLLEEAFADGGEIYVAKLIRELEIEGVGKFGEREFRKEILNSIRGAGVLIVGTSKGVKLVRSKAALFTYMDSTDALIGPQLLRVNKVDEATRAWLGKPLEKIVGVRPLGKAVQQYIDSTRKL